MGQVSRSAFASLVLLLVTCAETGGTALAAKDQSRIDGLADPGPLIDSGAGLPGLPSGQEQDPTLQNLPDDDSDAGEGDPASLPVYPPIDTIELTPEIARNALDALHEVKDKYEKKGLDNYDTLEQFVEEAEAGAQLDSDIRRFGFKSVTDWNSAILSIEFAYSALEGDGAEIRNEIQAVRNDGSMSDKERKEVLDSLEALLSTDNNKAVVRDLLNDAKYATKLKILDAME